jgi:CRP-like cAMP-binding protein
VTGDVFMTANIKNTKLMLEALYSGGTLCPFASGRKIPLSGDDIYIVARGIIQIRTQQSDGNESILGLIGPMMPVAKRFTLVKPYEVYALTHVDLLHFRWKEVQASAKFMNELNHAIIRRLRCTEMMLSLLSKQQVLERLIGFFSFLSQEFGQPTPHGIRLEVQLTHQQIADALNTTRVTVTRLIGDLRRASFIRIDKDRHLYVLDELSIDKLGFSKFF